VLIRFGHSLTVGIGTAVRLLFDGIVLAAGFAVQSIPGTTVATAAIIAGVVGEAAYAGWRVRPVLRDELPESSESGNPLTYRDFFRFYVPLSLTTLIFLGARPVLTAAVSRMPSALDSLAILPVVTSLTFLLRSVGVAYSEVVIAHLDTRGSSGPLRRFALGLIAAVTLALLVVAATPLSRLWFGTITGLSGNLVRLARSSLWLALLLPGLSTLQSWIRGIVLHSRRTRSVTEATLFYFALLVGILCIGIEWARFGGVYVGLAAMSAGELAGALWLIWRSRGPRRALHLRDAS
jgi:hypothetical protein